MIVLMFNGQVILESEDEAEIAQKVRELEAGNPNRRAVREIIGGVDTVMFYHRAPEPPAEG